MFFKIKSFALSGILAIEVSVEVHISNGIPSFTVVGLPDKAVNEARQRVRAAIINSEYKFPLKRIIINLSPADIRKEGSLYDLPIAIAILAASGQVDSRGLAFIKNSSFIGELSLDGIIQPVKGVISMAEHALKTGKKFFIIPAKNLKQAELIEGIINIGCKNLSEVLKIIGDSNYLEKYLAAKKKIVLNKDEQDNTEYGLDFSDIKGQLKARRAVEIAVCGMHNIMLIGPPGAGKTMLAQRIITVMPGLTDSESIEVTKIYSLINGYDGSLIKTRPFRNPHHTISRASFTGGGSMPKPGEISLAHRGILFLDEFHQFPKVITEDLRQPLENKKIVISRNNLSLWFPCSFMLVVATNPCHCGYKGDYRKKCTCSPGEIKKYWNSISGPIMDRIDMKINVPGLKEKDMLRELDNEASSSIRKRVLDCQKIQGLRYHDYNFKYNSEAGLKFVNSWLKSSKNISGLMSKIINKYSLSGRAVASLLKVSRTIADIDNSAEIDSDHLIEAITYRMDCNFYGK